MTRFGLGLFVPMFAFMATLLLAAQTQAQCIDCQPQTTAASVQYFDSLPGASFDIGRRTPVRNFAAATFGVIRNAGNVVRTNRINARAYRYERAVNRANARISYFNAAPYTTFQYQTVPTGFFTYRYASPYRMVFRGGNCGCPDCICGDNCNCHTAPATVIEEIVTPEVAPLENETPTEVLGGSG